MSDAARAEAARLVLAAWDAASARYTLLHGLENPAAPGRDLDILIPVGDGPRLIATARGALEAAGFTVAEPPPIWGTRIIAVRGGWDTAIEFHTITAVIWRNVVLARCTGGPRDPWPAFSKRVLLPLLSSGAFEKAAAAFAEFRSSRDALAEKCAEYLGEEETAQLFGALESNDATACDPRASGKAVMLRFAIRHPFQSLVSFSWQAIRRILSPLFPCAPVVAVVGPDGVGKSTLIAAIANGSKSVFTKIVVRHWRPGLLPNLGGRSSGTPGPPRRHPGRFPWLRVAYYFWDYLLGHWLVDRRDTCAQRLVIYDRCALDMAVDPLRYGLSSATPARWLWRLTPKPDLIIFLDGDPDTIHARKPELPPDEIAAFLAKWRTLRENGTVTAMVKSTPPIETTVESLRTLMIGALITALGNRRTRTSSNP